MTTASLIAKLKLARQSKLPLPDHAGRVVIISRPSEIEVAEYREIIRVGDKLKLRALIRAHSVGWEGFIESDFDNGGTSDAVPFDVDLLIEWLEDRHLTALTIQNFIIDSVSAYEEAKQERLGK